MPHIPVRPPFGAAARSKSAVVPICRTLEGLQTLAGFQDQCIDSGILPSALRASPAARRCPKSLPAILSTALPPLRCCIDCATAHFACCFPRIQPVMSHGTQNFGTIGVESLKLLSGSVI